MENNKRIIDDMTFDELRELKSEVVLNSSYLADYENDFGVDKGECIDFFDAYCEYLFKLNDKHNSKEKRIEKILKRFDNDDNYKSFIEQYKSI